MYPGGEVGVLLQHVQLGLERALRGAQDAHPANILEAVVDFLYKDDCRAVIKSEDQEFVENVALHRGGLLLVSRDGKAWTGTYQQGKAHRANSKSGPTDLIKLKCLPRIHRTVSAVSDSKGRNFSARILASKREQNLATLPREVSEFDSLHNVICQVGDRRCPAHSFVLASGSESLSKQLSFAELQEEQEQVVVQVEEVHPDMFQPVLQFLYTKLSDLFQDGTTCS